MSLLHAANVREQLVKMADEYIDPVNGSNQCESQSVISSPKRFDKEI